MLDSFNIALSGLDSNSEAINNVGDNLANLNTTGYKADSTDFQDMVSSSYLGSGEISNGTGVGQTLNMRQFTAGTIETTTSPLDAAIQGDGFFVVTANGATQYTRDGTFTTDQNGNLTTASGGMVQGWMASSDGTLNTSGAVGNINIPPDQTLPPVATTQFTANLNLDASASGATGAFSVPVQVYDSLGVAHTLTMTFTPASAGGTSGTSGSTATPGSWDYSINIPSGDLGTAPTAPLATGTLTFDSSGNLTSPAASASPVAVSISGLADGAADMSLNWNLFNTNGSPAITQFASASATSSTTQDGSAAADVTGISIANGGQVVATYSNGTQQVEAQIAVAGISNPNSLIASGNNNFVTSADTATPVVGMPGTGGRGQVEGSALEESNVDIGTEFTNLMVYERAYQADSKVIMTTDDMMQSLVNLIQQ